jgi:hypothetical protein
MIGIGLLYGGLLLGLAGALSVLRPIRRLGIPTRRRAALVVAAGALAILAAVALPAPQHRATGTTELDRFVPAWQFAERHALLVHAPLERVEAAIHAVTASDIRFFRILTWIRQPRLPGRAVPESIMAPSEEKPILDVALSTGFIQLADVPGRELVVGTLVLVPAELRRLPPAELARLRREWSPERFRTLASPGFAKAAMSFLLADRGDGWTDLSTETRVVATDAGAERRFRAYWRTIYPGSSLIRREWLAAVRNRAEAADAGTVSVPNAATPAGPTSPTPSPPKPEG